MIYPPNVQYLYFRLLKTPIERSKITCLDAGGTASLSALTPVPCMHCDRHLPTANHHESRSKCSGNDQLKLDVCQQKLCLEQQMLVLTSKKEYDQKDAYHFAEIRIQPIKMFQN